jgi:hypothetical protein
MVNGVSVSAATQNIEAFIYANNIHPISQTGFVVKIENGCRVLNSE